MGHYLTYESLRHNQLLLTFKDHLSDGHHSFLPSHSLPTHLLRLANARAVEPLAMYETDSLTHYLTLSHAEVLPSWGPGRGVPWRPLYRP